MNKLKCGLRVSVLPTFKSWGHLGQQLLVSTSMVHNSERKHH